MTDKKAERYQDLANRFGPAAARRIVDAEFAEELDLENHEGIQQLREWREAKREQKRLEQEAREQERQEALRAKASAEMRALESRKREQYLRAGGTPEEWHEVWPSIRNRILEQRTLAPEDYYNAAQNAF